MTEVATSAADAAETTMDRFVIDTRASRFTVRAFATGILSAMGHSPTIGIRTFSGEMKFHPEQLRASAMQLVINSSSLGVQDDISDKDRREMERMMNEEVLETGKFPEIRYVASGISVAKMGDALFSAKLDGSLTLHGVTRRESITTRVALVGAMLRASGEFSLNQSNYGIKPVSVAGGALKLKDELKFSFEIVARKQE
ncbi:MAG: YceI family protein [Terracidiphilus sp.]